MSLNITITTLLREALLLISGRSSSKHGTIICGKFISRDPVNESCFDDRDHVLWKTQRMPGEVGAPVYVATIEAAKCSG